MNRTCRNFTLVEVVAVMMVFALVIGVAATSIRKIPALVSLKQVVSEFKQGLLNRDKVAYIEDVSCAFFVVWRYLIPAKERKNRAEEKGNVPNDSSR